MITQEEFEFLFYSARRPPREEEPECFRRFLEQTFGPDGPRMAQLAYKRRLGRGERGRRARVRAGQLQLFD